MDCTNKLKLFVMGGLSIWVKQEEMMASNKVCRMRIKSVGGEPQILNAMKYQQNEEWH